MNRSRSIGLVRNSFPASVYVVLTLVLLPTASVVEGGLLIVDWGGDYVSSVQDLQGKDSFFDNTGINADGDGLTDDSIGGRLFSETTAMNPTSGYSGTSGTFYGGAITAHQDDLNDSGFGEFAIQNQGTDDELHVHLSEAGHDHDLHLAMYWDQADFLNGGDAIPVTLDETSSVSIQIGPAAVESLVDAQIRLMVRDALGNFWLSETAYTSPNSNTSFTWDSGNQGFSASSDGEWAAYNPHATFPGASAAGSDLRFNQGSATFSAQNFSSITAIGYYFEQDTFHNNLDFHISDFSVTASTVPEPSTLSLLGIGAFCLAGHRLGRRKRKPSVDIPA